MTLPPPRPSATKPVMEKVGLGCALLIVALVATVCVAVVWWFVTVLL